MVTDSKHIYPKDVMLVSGIRLGDRLAFETIDDTLFIAEINQDMERTYYPMSSVHRFKIGAYGKRG